MQPDRHRCSGELRRREPVQQQQQQTPKSHQLYLPAFTPTLTPTHPTDMSHGHTSLCHWMFSTNDSCCNVLYYNGRLSSQGVAEHMCAHLSQVNAAVAKPMSSNLSETSFLKGKKTRHFVTCSLCMLWSHLLGDITRQCSRELAGEGVAPSKHSNSDTAA